MITHNSRDTFYRIPFGAVPNGTTVILRLSFKDEILPAVCRCNVWKKDYESEIDMQYLESDSCFECTVDAVSDDVPLWYYFVFIYSDGRMLFYGNNTSLTGGIGQIFELNPLSYQITVYDSEFKTPDWWKQGPVYHIFIDRFAKSENWTPDEYTGYIYHDNWDELPLYLPHGGKKEYFPDDFFGGTLAGIVDKLDYIQGLGIKTIYLSPILEAHSNHKYDTANYQKIDPMFGSTEIFNDLCDKSEKLGMKVILDGVFSHTGYDSIYFNKQGRYDSIGAYQSMQSPFYEWYTFEKYPDKYKCWWNIETMPTVNKDNEEFQELIYGNNGVVQKWLDEGASGWRLDVADELPMDFLKGIRKSAKSTDSEALIIGEIWEDASNKVSYGEIRNYCYGNTLDSVMNYPLRTAILDFMLGKNNSEITADILNSQLENYPSEFLNAAMNLLGSHDRARLRTVFSDAPDPDSLTRTEQAEYVPSANKFEQSVKRVKCAAALLFTMPGVPYIYYGDETGMTGMADPFNRRTFPWGNEDTELIEFFRLFGNLRKNNNVLINGDTKYFPINDDVLGCLRTQNLNYVFTVINRSIETTHTFNIKLPSKELYDTDTGKKYTADSTDSYTLTLEPITYITLKI